MATSGTMRPIAQFTAEDIHGPYGFMDQPGFAGTDKLADLGFVNVFENDHVRYDPIVECVYAELMFVPYHNLRTGKELDYYVTSPEGLTADPTEIAYDDEQPRDGLPDYPVLRWELLEKRASTDFMSKALAPMEYTGLMAQLTPGKEHDPGGLWLRAKCEGDNLPENTRGFSIFHRQVAGDAKSQANRKISFQFFISDDEGWTLEYKAGEGLILYRFDSSGAHRLAKLQSTQSYAELVGRDQHRADDAFGLMSPMSPVVSIDQTAATILLINNLLQIQVQGQMQPCVIPAKADYFTKVEVLIDGGRYCYFSLHPVSFAASGYMTSNVHQLGFVRRKDTPISYSVLGKNPDGCSTDVTTVYEQDSVFRYRLTFTGPVHGTYQGVDYSRDTAVARSVTFNVPAHISDCPRTGMAEYPIREVTIVTAFDWHNMNIVSKADVLVNNRRGEWRDGWPAPQRGVGNRAVTLDLGWDGADGWNAVNRRFTGLGGLDMTYMRGPAPESMVKISCEDLSVILRDYEMMGCPWMDGWCHLYAIRFLAELAGFTDAQMDFEYCGDSHCTNPNHYRLPIGEGGKPLMRFPCGTTVRAAMQQIQFLTGHLLYFDVSGKLKYYPWVRLSPGPYKRTFYDAPHPNIDPHQSIQQVSFTRSNRSIRTHLTVIGVDAYGPAWNPIVSHRANERSVNDPTDYTYVGYRKPRAVADSRFATLALTKTAADSLFALENRPSEEIVFQMQAMSDLYPMDVIGLVDMEMPTSIGTTPTPFFITQIRERMTCTRTQKDYSMTVNARRIV